MDTHRSCFVDRSEGAFFAEQAGGISGNQYPADLLQLPGQISHIDPFVEQLEHALIVVIRPESMGNMPAEASPT